MTQVQSNSHRVEIVAPSGSAFQNNAASLSAGQFAAFTMPSVPSITGGSSDSIFEYVSRIGWDATNKKQRFVGISHSTGVARYLEYRDTLNNWTQEVIPDGRSDPRHGYSGTACDQAGQEFYFEGNGGAGLWKRNAAGSWSSFTCPQAGWAQVEWNPGLSRLVIGQVWGFRTFNPADNSFATLRNTPGGTDMADGPGASAYSPKDNCTYHGNTNGSNGKLWKVSAAGVVTQIANAPVTVSVQSAGNNCAMLCGSANSANKLLAIRQNAEVYEYDDVGNSWSGALSTNAGFVSFIQGATNNQWVAGPISTYGVIAFFRESPLATFDSTYWLWKR